MKDKKGFTLVEVLGAVVVLVLVLAIITPKVFKQFKHAGEVTDQEQINALLNASKIYVNQNLNLFMDEDEDEYIILINELKQAGLINNETILLPSTQQELEGCVVVTRKNNKFNYNYEESDKCDKQTGTVKFKQVKDKNPGVICGEGETEDYDNSDTCYIYSVEDLVEFSNLVNSGKNFSGKTVMLMNNLDIQNDKSYLNAKINLFGDVNEDGTISATLKEELTDENGKGFKPIGNDSNKFSGTFEGNAKTIKNLYINRDNTSYTALFGYNSGTIRGLRVVDAEITGNQYVGLITGYNYGNVTGIIAAGNVSGLNYVGLVAGDNYGSGHKIEAIASGNVVSTDTSHAYAGGITGHQYNATTIGIYKSGSITTATSSDVHRTIGYWSGGSGTTGALSTITQNGNTVTSSNINSVNGYDIPANAMNNIAMIDAIVDTYLGGDNNNDGYYYDYDANGEFTVYSLAERPLNITMSGSGTSGDPYIINNYNELKQVGYNLGTNGSGIYYRLNADIDLTNENSIMLGSGDDYDATKRFTGVFDGNAHTISNLKLYGHNYVGLSGYNAGTIKGLKLVDANVTGYQYVGLLAGYNYGIVTGIIAAGNVSGLNYEGLVAGYNYANSSNSYSSKIEAIVSGNIVSTDTSYAYVGGVTGGQYNAKTTGIYKSGSITTATSSYAYRTIGYLSGGTGTTGALDTITVNGNTVTSSNINSVNGYDIPANAINNIAITDAIVDTYLGGDNNNDGYYYDYDANGEFTVYKLSERPLEITMDGEGTQDEPYIINNYNDLKQVGYKLGTAGNGIYYSLNADIDLTNKNSIMLGSANYGNYFKGVFDGNAHTISNLNLYGHNYAGLFGYNSGTIKGLKVENVNISGNQYVGLIAGYNYGIITGLIANGNVSGSTYIGLVAGDSYADSSNSYRTKIEAIVSGNIVSTATNNAYVGGITGRQYNSTTTGIYRSGSITADTSSNVYRTIGYWSGGSGSTGALDTITQNGNTITSSNINSVNGKSYTASELQSLTPYQEVGLNTSSTTGEYRYELDSNYNPYLIKN